MNWKLCSTFEKRADFAITCPNTDWWIDEISDLKLKAKSGGYRDSIYKWFPCVLTLRSLPYSYFSLAARVLNTANLLLDIWCYADALTLLSLQPPFFVSSRLLLKNAFESLNYIGELRSRHVEQNSRDQITQRREKKSFSFFILHTNVHCSPSDVSFYHHHRPLLFRCCFARCYCLQWFYYIEKFFFKACRVKSELGEAEVKLHRQSNGWYSYDNRIHPIWCSILRSN